MKKKTKLVYGVGINDADYPVTKTEVIDGKSTQVWRCPIYWTWKDMLRRCYSEEFKQLRPSYQDCSTVLEWHYFMNFRAWMSEQDWEGKELDKDILLPGNKIYGPDTCVFVTTKVNNFIIDRSLDRGLYPVGVYFSKSSNNFRAYCQDVNTNKRVWLGTFSDPKEAHECWLSFKLSQAYILAAEESDGRVGKALIDRYKNYKKYFPQGA